MHFETPPKEIHETYFALFIENQLFSSCMAMKMSWGFEDELGFCLFPFKSLKIISNTVLQAGAGLMGLRQLI